MNDQVKFPALSDLPPTATPVDRLVTSLLGCGGPLSSMVNSMVEYQASGRSAPDAPPIPEVAHRLVASVVQEAVGRYTDAEIGTAAVMIDAAMDAVCENLFIVPPRSGSPISRRRR
jgi:hypothetical protein